METLEKIQKKHAAILMAFNQVESVLQPIHTGESRKDSIFIKDENIERLAKISGNLSNDFCKITVITELKEVPTPGGVDRGTVKVYNPVYRIDLAGENFGFSFDPERVCTLKKGLEKSFKAAESFTRQAAKAKALNPALVPVNKPETSQTPPALSIKPEPVLINDSKKLHNNSINTYICKNNEADMVTLQIKKVAFDLIKAGTKKTEWRSPSRFNKKRLLSVNKNGEYDLNTDIKEIKFINGRKPDAPALIVEVLEIRPVKFTREIHIPEDDFRGHTGQCAIAIKLGKVKQVFN